MMSLFPSNHYNKLTGGSRGNGGSHCNRWLVAFLFSAVAALPVAPAAQVQEKLVVSIKPLHSLVRAIVGDEVDEDAVQLLVSGAASPHGYQLKPSQLRAVRGADIVLYVHPAFETFLDRAVKDNGEALGKTAPLTLLGVRGDHDGHDHGHGDHDDHDDHKDDHDDHDDHKDEHGHDDHDDHKDEHGHDDKHEHDEHKRGHSNHDDHDDKHDHDDHHDHGKHDDDHDDEHYDDTDWHVWLDPINAKAMATQIQSILSARYPENSTRYARNAAALQQQLDELNADIERILAPALGKHYIVFHDAYQYFEKRYGLNEALAVVISPNLPMSAKRLQENRALFAQKEIECAFREPQFSGQKEKLIHSVTGDDIRIGVLDPIGSGVDAGAAHYIEMMRALAESMRDCIAPAT